MNQSPNKHIEEIELEIELKQLRIKQLNNDIVKLSVRKSDIMQQMSECGMDITKYNVVTLPKFGK